MGLNAQEKKDLDKYTKHAVFKTIQVLIQSRLGDKLNFNCKAYPAGLDWVRIIYPQRWEFNDSYLFFSMVTQHTTILCVKKASMFEACTFLIYKIR